MGEQWRGSCGLIWQFEAWGRYVASKKKFRKPNFSPAWSRGNHQIYRSWVSQKTSNLARDQP